MFAGFSRFPYGDFGWKESCARLPVVQGEARKIHAVLFRAKRSSWMRKMVALGTLEDDAYRTLEYFQ